MIILKDLNDMECRPPREYVHITGDTTQNLNVEVRPNYADHPLLIGPRYVPRDIKLHFANILGTKMSGVNGWFFKIEFLFDFNFSLFTFSFLISSCWDRSWC